MEELLNKLIEKGWKPRGIYTSLIGGYGLVRCEEYVGSPNNERKSYRELVSKESGLWQFCVKNKLVKEDDGHITRIINLYKSDESIVDGGWDYHYWLMICSILDESELEDFLIENIKI